MCLSWAEQIRINQTNSMLCVRTFSKRRCSWTSSCCRHQTETRWHLLVVCSLWELAIKNAGSSKKKLRSLQSSISIRCTLPFPQTTSLNPVFIMKCQFCFFFLLLSVCVFQCVIAELFILSPLYVKSQQKKKRKKSSCSLWWKIKAK